MSQAGLAVGPAHTFCVATRLCEGLAVGQQRDPCHRHPKDTSILARLILKRQDKVWISTTERTKQGPHPPAVPVNEEAVSSREVQ